LVLSWHAPCLYCKNHVPTECSKMTEVTRGYQKLSGKSTRLVYGSHRFEPRGP